MSLLTKLITPVISALSSGSLKGSLFFLPFIIYIYFIFSPLFYLFLLHFSLCCVLNLFKRPWLVQKVRWANMYSYLKVAPQLPGLFPFVYTHVALFLWRNYDREPIQFSRVNSFGELFSFFYLVFQWQGFLNQWVNWQFLENNVSEALHILRACDRKRRTKDSKEPDCHFHREIGELTVKITL